MRRAAIDLVSKWRLDATNVWAEGEVVRARAIDDCADALEVLIESSPAPDHYRWHERLDGSWDLSPPGSSHVCATAWADGAWMACDKAGDVTRNGIESGMTSPIWLAKVEALAACLRSKAWPEPNSACTHSLHRAACSVERWQSVQQ